MAGGLMKRALSVVLVLALLAVALTGQAVADELLPRERDETTGRTLGRAGFAFLTGVRTYAAAVLWNRLDPLFHAHYEHVALHEQTFLLPSVWAIVALDPEFTQTYYVASWILARRGAVGEALDLAAAGVAHNPNSGLLRVNYAQIIYLFTDDKAGAVDQAKVALGDEIHWVDLRDQRDGYAIVRAILAGEGHYALADEVSREIEAIDAEIAQPEGAGAVPHEEQAPRDE